MTKKTLLCAFTGVLLTVAGIRPAHPCSGFTAHDGQTVLAGQNEGLEPGQGRTFDIDLEPEGGGRVAAVRLLVERVDVDENVLSVLVDERHGLSRDS